jgi:hypothetical protein
MGRFSMIIVVGFIVIAGIMKLSHGRLGNQAQQMSSNRYVEYTARNATTSAVNMSLYQISQNFNWRSGFSNVAIGNATANVQVQGRAQDSTLQLNQIRITATGTYGSVTKTAIVVMQKSAFSEFAYFTDNEPLIYFITGDTIRGPIHTNGQFHISGNPVFYGLVSMVATSMYGSGSPEYKAGTNFGALSITLPTDLTIITNMASSGGVIFQGDVDLRFVNNGTVNWTVTHPTTQNVWNGHAWVNQTVIVTDSTGVITLANTNGIIMTNNNHDIHVQGTLNGQATVLADGNIWIDNDVLYASSPLTDPNAHDMLGLISRHNITVTDNTANQTDCTIMATLMALNTSFGVENYSSGNPRGVLTIVGGIVQNTRGAVGTFSGSTITHGYRKKYIYDSRFLTQAPPSYPVFSRNSIASWFE